MLAPGGDRIGSIEPRGRADRLPEPLEVGLAEDARRPADVRGGDDRPVDQPLGDEGAIERVQVARLGLADERGIEVGEELRLGVSGELDQGRPASPARSGPRRAGARETCPACPPARARSPRGGCAHRRSGRRRASRRPCRPRARSRAPSARARPGRGSPPPGRAGRSRRPEPRARRTGAAARPSPGARRPRRSSGRA